MTDPVTIAVAPDTRPTMFEALSAAVERGGATVGELADARALVFADPERPDLFPGIIGRAPGVEWIQLPYAGIEPFVDHLDADHVWTCGKGVYAEPVAEHVVALALAGFRDLHRYIRATSWSAQTGRNLLGARVTILGGGGITESLLRLLEPFGCEVTVVRRSGSPVAGAARTLTADRLTEGLSDADLVVVALALTSETTGIIDAAALAAMPEHAWLVNVARGGHVVTDDLVDALRAGSIAGAALDVTDPEPLPDDSPLWQLENCIITAHVGNTPEMGLPLLADRVEQNVRRYLAGEPLLGPVDVARGY